MCTFRANNLRSIQMHETTKNTKTVYNDCHSTILHAIFRHVMYATVYRANFKCLWNAAGFKFHNRFAGFIRNFCNILSFAVDSIAWQTKYFFGIDCNVAFDIFCAK